MKALTCTIGTTIFPAGSLNDLKCVVATRRQTCSDRRDERREFPETGMFLRAPLTSDFEAGGFITGSRRIVPAGRDALHPLTVGFRWPPNL
jgi:hypothetical protein